MVRSLVPLLLALTLLGCAGSPATSPGPQNAQSQLDRIPADAKPNADALVRVKAPELPGLLYVRPPRPHLQPYTHIFVVSSSIDYADGSDSWKEAEEARLRAYFDRKITEELESSSGWDLAAAPGEDVLAVAVGVMELDVKLDKRGAASAVSYRSASPGAVLVIELRDSLSQRILLRYVEKRQLPSGSFGGNRVEERRVRQIFAEFAISAALHLERYHETVREIEQIEAVGAGRG